MLVDQAVPCGKRGRIPKSAPHLVFRFRSFRSLRKRQRKTRTSTFCVSLARKDRHLVLAAKRITPSIISNKLASPSPPACNSIAPSASLFAEGQLNENVSILGRRFDVDTCARCWFTCMVMRTGPLKWTVRGHMAKHRTGHNYC